MKKANLKYYALLLITMIALASILVILGEFVNKKDILSLKIWLIDYEINSILNIITITLEIIFENIRIGTVLISGVYFFLCRVNFYKHNNMNYLSHHFIFCLLQFY